MFKRLLRRLMGRDISGITKRMKRDQADIDANIASNDALIANASEVISALKQAQDKLQAQNATGLALRDSISVIG